MHGTLERLNIQAPNATTANVSTMEDLGLVHSQLSGLVHQVRQEVPSLLKFVLARKFESNDYCKLGRAQDSP